MPLLFARLHQLVKRIDDRVSSIWSFQRKQGCSLRRLQKTNSQPSPPSNIYFAGEFSFIPKVWPSQCSRWMLIRCTTLLGCRNHFQLALNLKLRKTVLSNTLLNKATALVLNSVNFFLSCLIKRYGQ